jgi:hypothetical protein
MSTKPDLLALKERRRALEAQRRELTASMAEAVRARRAVVKAMSAVDQEVAAAYAQELQQIAAVFLADVTLDFDRIDINGVRANQLSVSAYATAVNTKLTGYDGKPRHIRFASINVPYEALIDPVKRAKWLSRRIKAGCEWALAFVDKQDIEALV